MSLHERIARAYIKKATLSWDKAIDLLDIGKNPTAKDVEDLLRDLSGHGPVPEDVAEAANFVLMNMGENTVEGQKARGEEILRGELQHLAGDYYSIPGKGMAVRFALYGWALCTFSVTPNGRVGLVMSPNGSADGLVLQPHWREDSSEDEMTEAIANKMVASIRASDSLAVTVREEFRTYESWLKVDIPDTFRKSFLDPVNLSKLATKAALKAPKKALWPYSGGKPQKV